MSCRGRCCCSMYGICTLTRRPTSSMSTSDVSGARSTANRLIRSFIPSAGSGFVSVLLTKTLRSSTLRLALICVALFGAVVCALFGYVYSSTASYVRGRSDRAIAAEHVILRQADRPAGRGRLLATIGQRIAEGRFDGGLYLLADASFAPVAGNLKVWPTVLNGPGGLGNFDAPEWKPDAADRPLLRASFETLPDGYLLLVGKDIDDLDEFAEEIEIALSLSILLTFVLGVFTAVFVTRRTIRRTQPTNPIRPAIFQTAP